MTFRFIFVFVTILFLYLHVYKYLLKRNEKVMNHIEYRNRDEFEYYCRTKYPLSCKVYPFLPKSKDFLRPPFTLHSKVRKLKPELQTYDSSRTYILLYRGECHLSLYSPEQALFLEESPEKVRPIIEYEIRENQLCFVPPFWHFSLCSLSDDIDGIITTHDTIIDILMRYIFKTMGYINNNIEWKGYLKQEIENMNLVGSKPINI